MSTSGDDDIERLRKINGMVINALRSTIPAVLKCDDDYIKQQTLDMINNTIKEVGNI